MGWRVGCGERLWVGGSAVIKGFGVAARGGLGVSSTLWERVRSGVGAVGWAPCPQVWGGTKGKLRQGVWGGCACAS